MHAAAKAETQNRFARQRRDQGDIAGSRACELPSERAIAVKILPTVAFADIARARRAKRILLGVVDGRKRQPYAEPESPAPLSPSGRPERSEDLERRTSLSSWFTPH